MKWFLFYVVIGAVGPPTSMQMQYDSFKKCDDAKQLLARQSANVRHTTTLKFCIPGNDATPEDWQDAARHQ